MQQQQHIPTQSDKSDKKYTQRSIDDMDQLILNMSSEIEDLLKQKQEYKREINQLRSNENQLSHQITLMVKDNKAL